MSYRKCHTRFNLLFCFVRCITQRIKMTNEQINPSKAEYIIQQLNATNAKKVAFLLVFGFICYHGLIHLRYGMC